MHSSYWYLLTNFCTSSSLSGDYIDVNSNKSSTIYDSSKTMKLEGSTVNPLYLSSIIFNVFMP